MEQGEALIMEFGKNYKMQKMTTCLTNMIGAFKAREDNMFAEAIMQQRIDNAISRFYQDTAFRNIIYYCIYIECACTTQIKIGRVNKKYEDVKLESFIFYKLVKAADELDSDAFVAFHEILLLDGIIAASKKYKIPEENYKELLERRSKLGTIPEWIPEMEDNPQLVIDMYRGSVPK
jgi:hypothetical protein